MWGPPLLVNWASNAESVSMLWRHHWLCNDFVERMTSLEAPEVVVTTISDATSDDNVDVTTTRFSEYLQTDLIQQPLKYKWRSRGPENGQRLSGEQMIKQSTKGRTKNRFHHTLQNITSLHDDVINWKHFPRYWTFVWEFTGHRGIPRTKGQWRENKRLSKQSWGWWFETPSRQLIRHSNVFKRLEIFLSPTRAFDLRICSLWKITSNRMSYWRNLL